MGSLRDAAWLGEAGALAGARGRKTPPRIRVYKGRYNFIVVADRGWGGRDTWEMSENAMSPNGVNLFMGSMRRGEPEDFGERVKTRDLPTGTQRAIEQLVSEYMHGFAWEKPR